MGGQTLSDILFSGKNRFKALYKFFIKIAIFFQTLCHSNLFRYWWRGNYV